jgi:hypothetical protein
MDDEEEEEEETKDENDDQDDTRSQTQAQTQEPDLEDSDSDEEDRPLALKNNSKPPAQAGFGPARHGGKKTAGHMTVAGTAPAPQTSHPLAHGGDGVGATSKSKGKHEELGAEQLQRLATGVTVDTEGEIVQVN